MVLSHEHTNSTDKNWLYFLKKCQDIWHVQQNPSHVIG